METKLITKTIKELADEYDGNVEQLHREIRRHEKVYDWKKKEIESLKYGIELERWARQRAEKVSDTSIFVMFSCVAVMFAITTYNYLFV
jgi:hypothetical protein